MLPFDRPRSHRDTDHFRRHAGREELGEVDTGTEGVRTVIATRLPHHLVDDAFRHRLDNHLEVSRKRPLGATGGAGIEPSEHTLARHVRGHASRLESRVEGGIQVRALSQGLVEGAFTDHHADFGDLLDLLRQPDIRAQQRPFGSDRAAGNGESLGTDRQGATGDRHPLRQRPARKARQTFREGTSGKGHALGEGNTLRQGTAGDRNTFGKWTSGNGSAFDALSRLSRNRLLRPTGLLARGRIATGLLVLLLFRLALLLALSCLARRHVAGLAIELSHHLVGQDDGFLGGQVLARSLGRFVVLVQRLAIDVEFADLPVGIAAQGHHGGVPVHAVALGPAHADGRHRCGDDHGLGTGLGDLATNEGEHALDHMDAHVAGLGAGIVDHLVERHLAAATEGKRGIIGEGDADVGNLAGLNQVALVNRRALAGLGGGAVHMGDGDLAGQAFDRADGLTKRGAGRLGQLNHVARPKRSILRVVEHGLVPRLLTSRSAPTRVLTHPWGGRTSAT